MLAEPERGPEVQEAGPVVGALIGIERRQRRAELHTPAGSDVAPDTELRTVEPAAAPLGPEPGEDRRDGPRPMRQVRATANAAGPGQPAPEPATRPGRRQGRQSGDRG